MDWQPIIIDILSVTSILSIVGMIRFWKQNKRLKDNEVRINDTEVSQANVRKQESEIDLASKYRDEMLSMVKMVKEANERNFDNQDQMIAKLDRMDTRLEKIEIRVSDIETYLNGNYHKWLSEKKPNNEEN